MHGRVFVVTGANKGIGYYAVKQLCSSVSDADVVYLTARNVDLGMQSVRALEAENLKPQFHQLDINDRTSIEAFRDFLLAKHGGLDVLINNAAIASQYSSTATFPEQAKAIVGCNYFSTLVACEILFPILRSHARVVNVSSRASRMYWPKLSHDVQSKFANPALTIKGLNSLMQEFVDAAQTDSHVQAGFANHAYGMSKIAITILAKIQQRDADLNPESTVVVNSCCPGFCDTDINNHKGPRPPADGARVLVYLALLPKDWSGEKGEFWEDNNVTPFPPR